MLLIKSWSCRRSRLSAALVAAVTVAACQDQGESPVGPQASAAFAKGGVGGGTGGGKTEAPGQVGKILSVSISPTTAEVLVNGTQAFTATVTNATNTSVTWSATCGTFGGTGSPVTWTAPATAGSCTVTATSVADGTKSAAATVTVTSPPNLFYLAGNGVTILCPSAAVGEKGTVNGVEYTKRDYQGITIANAASTCTSGITGMNGKFQDSTTFNADIRHWDTGDVTDMSYMFQGATAFNQPISAWNTAKVTNMSFMFDAATSFNQNMGDWKTSSVIAMTAMFRNAKAFNRYLDRWCVSSIFQKPQLFDDGATAWVLPSSRPVWGTCPTP